MIKTISLIVLGLIMTGYCIAGDLSDNFNEREFRCKCCRDLKLDTKLIDALEELRTFLDIPIYVTSGYRCEAHNTEVCGASRSQHMVGRAADIQIRTDLLDNNDLYQACKQLEIFGFIQKSPTFVHVDVRR